MEKENLCCSHQCFRHCNLKDWGYYIKPHKMWGSGEAEPQVIGILILLPQGGSADMTRGITRHELQLQTQHLWAAGHVYSFTPTAGSTQNWDKYALHGSSLPPISFKQGELNAPIPSTATALMSQGQSPGCARDSGDAQQRCSSYRNPALHLSIQKPPP